MITLDQVAELASALPETAESTSYGDRSWTVGGKMFAWERRFSKADVRRFGDDPVPAGAILGVRLADLGEKDAVLAAGTRGVFTIPHFDNYAAVLVQLDAATKTAVRALLVDGWLACAPRALAEEHAASLTRR